MITEEDKVQNAEIEQQRNIALNEEEYSSGKIILESMPQGLGIGAHYRCNAKCIFCLGGFPVFFSNKIYKEFFEKKLSAVLYKARFVNFCGFGEFLLMPEVEEFLDYINKKIPHINKILTTNGIPLTQEIANRLIQSKYDVQISLHASNSQLHRLLTRTDVFNHILSQIEYLVSLRRNKQCPAISLIFLINTLNVENLPNFMELADQLGVDEVICNYMTVYTPTHLKISCFFKQKITNLMLKKAEEIARDKGIRLRLPPMFGKDGKPKQTQRCDEPWKYLYVETKGSILPCCYAGAHIGYLYRDEFDEVWNGEFYKNLRRSLIEGNNSGWCKYCYKNNPLNVKDIRAHVSFRPDLQQKILKGFNLE